MLKGLIGKKIGMTQIFDEQGVAYPVTIIEAGPCYVTQVRSQERDGYLAVQLGYSEIHPKKLASGELGHLKANGLPPMKFLRVSSEAVNVGDKLTVDVFPSGDMWMCWHSKGKALPARQRYHFKGGKASHGQSDRHLHQVRALGNAG
jgi:large subunit ribosomal protein L3